MEISKLKELGLNIKKHRKEKGLTQEMLAKNMGKVSSTITRIECGKVNPSIKILYLIADGLGVGIFDIIPKKTI